LRQRHSAQHGLNDDEFTSSMFPFSAETIEPLVIGEFDFPTDLARLKAEGHNLYQNFARAVAVIPEKFRQAIHGSDLPPRPHNGGTTCETGPAMRAPDPAAVAGRHSFREPRGRD
jgi:hypothetical protein